MPQQKKKIKQEEYKINFVDKIIDPVHGFIDVTEVESKIIELPIFKRQQNLKQLSLTNWVFPGAEHTRYIHSLGVMYIADEMAKNLRRTTGELVFNDGQRQLLRLAGLLHDIGHYPLSHITESAYMDNLLEGEKTFSDLNKKTLNSIKEAFGRKTGKEKRGVKFHHEEIGKEVIGSDKQIKRIIEEYCPFIKIEDIQDIIIGNCEGKPHLSAMVQLMHSELDADGIDYIMRDATFSGTSYGDFEFGRLLRCLTVSSYNGVDIVGVTPKGIAIVDQYLVNKYFSYTQVILNRHVTILNEMAKIYVKGLIESGDNAFVDGKKLLTSIHKHDKNSNYLKFTDYSFWNKVNYPPDKNIQVFMQEIYKKLQNYQEFDMTPNGEFVISSTNKDAAYNDLIGSEIYKRLETNSQDAESTYLYTYVNRSVTKEVPQHVLRQRVESTMKDTATDEEKEEKFRKHNISRLQEGIVVIDMNDDENIKLLVDDSRSVISHIYGLATHMLREYKI